MLQKEILKLIIIEKNILSLPKALQQNQKNSLKFRDFELGIKGAINREKDLAEDIKKIKNELGTNVGLLVNEMLKEK